MADLTDIGCCSCFSFLRKPSASVPQPRDADGTFSEELLKRQSADDPDESFYTGDDPDLSLYNGDNLDGSFFNGDGPDRCLYDEDGNDFLDGSDDGPPRKSSEDIIQSRAQNGFACREIPVKETNKVFRSEDENGNKMVNQYVHLGKIGSGSYGKVVLYRNVEDGKLYAVKVLNKPYMMKVRVVRSETAMTDVLREPTTHPSLSHSPLPVLSLPPRTGALLSLPIQEWWRGSLAAAAGLPRLKGGGGVHARTHAFFSGLDSRLRVSMKATD
ncbi:serine/threonine-protein kinase GRIK1-like [Panicum miliaceum]|uniref:Serine/threonine-protein kinase GRIK1-like n=1 Tax=Panicum miliaceum TaxID=4540 RepID=A0A3L6TM71_PANMI|nr:serine/threonine-protein kinase GRIK1-like [Panicum miliaceum]